MEQSAIDRQRGAETTFDPATDSGKFRAALGMFPTGVTVVTTRHEGEPVGITVNSFSSVSLDPPLVLWCPAKGSRRFEIFCQAQHYSIHVLSAEQADLASAFVQREGAFKGLEIEQSAHGVPLLKGTLARFECTTDAVHDAGDHAIIVGRVTHGTLRADQPLVFCRGQYAHMAD